MMKKLIFTLVFVVGVFTLLTTGLSIVNAEENIGNKYSKTTTTNLTKIFGEPIYKEISRHSSNFSSKC